MDIQQAINGLLARYNQVQESVLTLGRWREAASQDIRRIAQEIQLMGKAAMDRERLLAGLKADNKTFQGQLRSLSVKVDELSREVRALKDHAAGKPGAIPHNHTTIY